MQRDRVNLNDLHRLREQRSTTQGSASFTSYYRVGEPAGNPAASTTPTDGAATSAPAAGAAEQSIKGQSSIDLLRTGGTGMIGTKEEAVS